MFVYGIFPDEESAADALSALVDADFPVSQISGLMHEGEQIEELPVEGKTGVARGAVIGAALGALGGAVLAPIGGFLAAGPLVAALQGATVGGAAGLSFGAFAGLGFWREEIDLMHRHLKQGDVVLGVETNLERRKDAEDALRTAGPRDVRASKDKESAVEEVREEQTEQDEPS